MGGKWGMATLVERGSRYPVALALPGSEEDAETVKDLLVGAVAKTPDNRIKTLT